MNDEQIVDNMEIGFEYTYAGRNCSYTYFSFVSKHETEQIFVAISFVFYVYVTEKSSVIGAWWINPVTNFTIVGKGKLYENCEEFWRKLIFFKKVWKMVNESKKKKELLHSFCFVLCSPDDDHQKNVYHFQAILSSKIAQTFPSF